MKTVNKYLAALMWLLSAMCIVGEPTENYNMKIHIVIIVLLAVLGYLFYDNSKDYEK